MSKSALGLLGSDKLYLSGCILVLVATACSVSLDVATTFNDLDDITYDLEYSWTNVTITSDSAERDEGDVGSLGMFDSAYCTKEEGGEIEVTCSGLPHSLVLQSNAAGEASNIDVEASRKDLDEQWEFRVVMVNPFTGQQDDLSDGELTWVVNMPGVITDSNADSVSESDGRAEFEAELADSRETFFAVSVQDKPTEPTPPASTPSSPFMCDNGVAVPDPANQPGLVEDCEALLASRDVLTSGGGATLNWHPESSVSHWVGVTTGGSPTRVTGLYLYNRDLSGEIPARLGELAGLETLWLHHNQLTGVIPSTLGGLSNLEQLSISHNRLHGDLPTELGSLPKLEELWLHNNTLTGEIPTELGNLPNLVTLWLHHNQLTGEIPRTLGGLSNLERLSISRNVLHGELPAELGGLPNLKELWLYDNNLIGEIPAELGNLSNLAGLWLYGNELGGEIPSRLGDLSNLAYLSLSGNRLMGSIPAGLGSLSNLEVLWLYDNRLTGEVPEELWLLSNLRSLYLCGNELTGTLPDQFGDASQIETDGCVPASEDQQMDPPPPLPVQPETPQVVEPTGTGVDVLDSRLVEIDFVQLADAIESRRDPASGLPTLVLNLFDDVVFTGVVEHVEPTSSGHSLWGSLEGVDLGTMTLVVNGSVVAGTVRTPDAVFTVKTTGQGEYVVRQIDESSLPPLGEPLRGPLSEPDRSPPRHPQEGDPMDPGTPDDTPEPSTPRKPTSEVDDNEPKSTGLFSELKGVPPMGTGVDALDSRLVEIDFAQLADVIETPIDPGSGLPTLVLNLFNDIVFTGVVEHVEPTSSGHALWGRLDGVELGTMAMVVNGSVVVGSVRTPAAAYAIRTVGSGAYVVRQIDESSLLPLGEPLRDPKPASIGSSQSVAGPPDDGSEIDVMVVYTPSSKHFEGGRAAVEALIDLFVAETNQAYANSGANQKIRLVLREALEYIEDGNSFLDLNRFGVDSDGHMDQVHELRDLYSADLAHILVARSVNVCGVAQFPSDDEPIDPETFGFGLTVNACGGLVFAHELGHNMGLRHDRYVEDQLGSAWNFGYVNQAVFEPGAPESAHWRTIMAYRKQCEEVGSYCPMIGYFSNTEVTYDGDPMGVPADHPSTGVDGPADAARTLNERREITANIRRSSSSPTPRMGLSLSPYWLAESGGIAGVTATLHRPSSADTVVTVTATPADAVSVSANSTLTIPAGQLVSFGDVTITGVDNSRQTGDVAATVSATASNSDSLGVISPEPVALAISDDETTPVVSLSLSPEEIVENGDRTTDRTYVTAMMDNRSGAETTVIVSAESPGAAIDSESVLIIPAGQTASVGSGVPVYALDDSKLTQAKKSVTVSAVATNPKGVTSPGSVTLTIIDDEAPYFADDSLAHTFTAGVSGSRFLPEAAHGDGTLTYSIAPSPGDGVTFSPGPPMIRVSPTAAAGETSYTLTASDADGETDTMTINVTVRSAVCPSNAAVAGYSDPGVVADCEALLVSRDALSGDQSLNWSEHLSMDSWEGIELAAGGRVVGLDMNSEGLTGTIPSELGSLSNLQYLDLSDNQLTGGIPPELGSLTNLESLHLWGNRLTGEIPRELGGLSNLIGLDLVNNQLSGTIPAELGSLSRLEWLFLNDNQLVGTIPVALDSLTNLENLRLSGNRLVGCIPDGLRDVPYNDLWGLGLPFCSEHHCVTGGAVADAANSDLVYDCETLLAARDTLAGTATLNWSANTSITGWNGITLGGTPRRVTGLDVSSLGMTGEIPRELGSLSNLQYLDLSDNQLTGVILGELGNLSHLEQLNLRDNGLTGVIPGELGGLASLQVLHLSGNHLVGCVPDGLRKVADSDLVSLALPFCGEHHCVTGGAVVDLTSTSLVSDCETLLAAGDTLAGTSTLNWSTDTSITFWDGVTLGRTPRSVTRLDVSELGLSGMIPNELGDLSNLQRLTLSNNQLTGTIPTQLGNLSNLTDLALGGNQLTGTIPTQLGNLANLTGLYLWGNQLNGTIPTQLGDLTNLTGMSLGGNELAGAIPTELGDLSSLEGLWLDENEFTGTIPTQLGSLSNLTELDLSGNQLTGPIPTELGNLSNLTGLYLYSNQLTGQIPTELGNLSNLTGMSLGGNELTGAIPTELGDLSSLEGLWLDENEFTGTIPTELGSLANLRGLYLYSNRLSGSIPTELSDLSNLTELNLHSNQLSGEIPTQLGNLSNLTGLYLGGNQLTGTIPTDLGDLTSLTELDLYSNQLTGQIPTELGNLSNLTGLYLYSNQLTGQIPTELGNLSNLTGMSLGGNELTGAIPTELGDLSNLTELNLHSNQLSGEIPTQLGNLSNLTGLYLGGNQLTGTIPTDLGDLTSLTELDLYSNQLTGQIPTELGNLSNLTGLFLRENQLTGCIPDALRDVESNDFDRVGLPFCAPQSPGAPTASTAAAGTPMVRINSPIPVTATFSEPVNGFTVDDITVVNGSAGNFAGGDGVSVYTLDVTPNAIGDVTVDIAADVAEDGDSNGNVAAIQLSLGIPYDDDHDGAINRAEVITAIGDYLFGGLLTRGQVIELIGLYLFG